jgi:heme-degrading monooxygenase HmoA
LIARIWTAKTSSAQAPAYADHFKHHVLPTLREVDGYVGAKLLEREAGDVVELIVITFWQSLDAVRQFAGPELEQAVVSEEVIPLLLEYDRGVRHYEVAVDEGTDA